MTEGGDDAVREAIDAWHRGGSDAVQEAVWSLTPQDQLRLFIELFNRRELDAMAGGIAESFVHDMRPTGIPGMEVYRGRDGYRRFVDEWLDAFPDASVEIRTIELVGTTMLAVFNQKVQGGGSGVPVSFPYAAILTFPEGHAETSEFHLDLDAARLRFEELAVVGRR